MFCPKCGKQLPDNAKFCTGCGTPVQKKQETSLPSHEEMMAKTKTIESKNKRTTLILFIVLIILILVAVGMGIFYFVALKEGGGNQSRETGKEIEESDEPDEDDQGAEPDEDAGDADAETADIKEDVDELQEDDDKVVSDTNEVVNDTILFDIPKALYSYDFDEDLGNAQIVVRKEGEYMPEVTDDIEPKYIAGMDGKAVYLDGNYGIQLSDVNRISSSYTVAFWIKADDLYDWAPFIHIGYNLLDSENRCRLWVGQKTDNVSVAPIISSEYAPTQDSFEIRPASYAVNTMNPNVWYHIVFVVDASKTGSRQNSLLGTLYVSGQYAGEGDIVLNTMNADDLTVYLGINCWDALYPVAFDGVKIWDQALDAQQVQRLFDAYN